MFVKHFFIQMILIYICSYKSYDIQCPHSSHWNSRADAWCKERSQYNCLFDENTVMYTELCRQHPDVALPGFKVVVRVYFDHRFCALNRYQPFVFRTNGSSECTFQKSLCSGEGQIIVTDKYLVTRTDTTCRCDYERGYSFIIQPNNIAHCVPSEEDCSCYNKLCNDGYILNAGYQCVTGSSSHNGSTTNNPSIPSKNKPIETEIVHVNPKKDKMKYMIPITFLTGRALLIAGLAITILLRF